MGKLQQSVLVLSAIKNTIEPVLMVFKRYIKDEDVKFVLHQQLLLKVCSFNEEREDLRKLSEENPKVKETLSIWSFALNRIDQWDGLRSMRNTMLAHRFRDNKNNKLPTDLGLRYFDANVPTTYCEALLLAELAYICCGVFIERHGNTSNRNESIYKGEIKERGINNAIEFDSLISENNKYMFSIDPSLEGLFLKYRTLVDVIENR